jgi:predicted DNA-binding transcriptional regulator AlpA
MENNGAIGEGYKENQKSHNEQESSKAQVLFDKLIWGIDEVCAFTRYAKGTVYNLVSEGQIPVRRRGRKGRLVFIPSEVIAWFKGE